MTKELLDADGENRAVRSFLMLYGGQYGISVEAMKAHMKLCGLPHWPAWADKEPTSAHLTKGGAQDWLRHLFALERSENQLDDINVVDMPAQPQELVILRMEWEPGYPEDVASGTQRQMDRLKKWLDKYFALIQQPAQPPAKRKPLTDEQIDAAVKAWFGNEIVAGRQPFAKRMRAAIEAAHGIKGDA